MYPALANLMVLMRNVTSILDVMWMSCAGCLSAVARWPNLWACLIAPLGMQKTLSDSVPVLTKCLQSFLVPTVEVAWLSAAAEGIDFPC